MDARALAEALEFYKGAGFDTLPLRPNTRVPFIKRWQDLDPPVMWRHAPTDANIGIRCAGRLQVAVLDADDKTCAGTDAKISNFLTGLGVLDCPAVLTPNGGRHFYFEAVGERAGQWCTLSPQVGAGEFRYGRGALVAAPPSEIGSKQYRLLAGDFTQLPRIAIADLAPILKAETAGSVPQTAREPYKGILQPSRMAYQLLQGHAFEKYKSRSEHEQALLTSLINSGYDFNAILSLFLQYPCGGKFSELYVRQPRNAIGYLKHSFESACAWAATHEGHGRQLARAAMVWANSQPWPGRTGAVDRAAFIAHMTIAYRSGRTVYAASCRDLAELAATRAITASKATHRLRTLGLIVLVQEATFHFAQTFQLGDIGTLSNYLDMGECTNYARGIGRATTLTSAHDAFRFYALGKIGAAVWEALSAHSPMTVQEISAQSGRSLRAVNRALERMFQRQMVGMDLTEAGETWYAVENPNLDDTARALGTFGAGERQRADHKAQRALYRHKYNGIRASAEDSGIREGQIEARSDK